MDTTAKAIASEVQPAVPEDTLIIATQSISTEMEPAQFDQEEEQEDQLEEEEEVYQLEEEEELQIPLDPTAVRKKKLAKPLLKKIQSLYQAMTKRQDAQIFLEKVLTSTPGCEEYYQKITCPITLLEIGAKLERYQNLKEFCQDVQLMIVNCFVFNPEGNYAREMGKSLGMWFHKQALAMLGVEVGFNQFDEEIMENHPRKRSASHIKDEESEEEFYRPQGTKRRLGATLPLAPATRGVNSAKVTSELESLSNSLETMNKKLENFEKSQQKQQQKYLPDSSELENEKENTPKPKKQKQKRQTPQEKEARICEYCACTTTPMWRRGPSGKATLCNKCGVKWRAGKVLQRNDGSVLQPPSPTTLSRPIKANKKRNSIPVQQVQVPIQSEECSYAQKEHVASVLTLGTLNSEQLCHIVNMIRVNVKGLKDSQEEIELDIEQLDSALVGDMYRYVVETVGLKPMQ